MDELNLDLDTIEANTDSKLQIKDRFAKLTEKGKEAEKIATDALAKAEAESQRASKAEKDLEFYKSFSQISSKHSEAANYQDQIKERVDKGYDPEEAALAVLAKEGKLTTSAPSAPRITAEGGSAQTNLGDGGNKAVSDMSSDEKLNALMQAEREGANLLKF